MYMMMNKINFLHVIFLLCMKTSLLRSESVSKDGNTVRCFEEERKALLVFTQGVVQGLHSWNKEEDCCKWKGVGCDNRTGHVTHLYLSSRISTFNVNSNSTSVRITRSLLDLPNLKYLDLSKNFIQGLTITSFIGPLTNLVHLDLSHTNLKGSIPNQIGNHSNLEHLDLSFNLFDGRIPKFINSLNNLRYLDLSNCFFSAINPYELPNLSKLQHLDLGYNVIEDRIPDSFGHMTALTYLNLGHNYLYGSISNSFGLMAALTYLNLGHNYLYGSISNSFGLMAALTYLNLSGNQFNGAIPKAIVNLSNLEVADFSSNKFTGSMPDFTQLPSLRGFQANSNKFNGYLPRFLENHSSLQILDVSNNHLRGSLPDFTGFSSLRVLNLYNNEFNGSLPDFMGCSSLQLLRLGNNQLTEWTTQSTGLLSSLEELDLSFNNMRGTISEAHLFNLSSLKYMRTSFNSLRFEFSSEWLPPFQLRELSLPSCKLGPKFPNWIRNQRYIDHLDISNSQISDTIPIWFWNLSRSMMLLNISSNKIRGKISWNYVSIQEIDLSSNYFNGPLPSISLGCLKINLSQNKFSGTLLLPVVEQSYFSDFYTILAFLDVSHNQLFGAIPDDSFIHFKDLVFLNLGYNNFSGRIPTSIGQLVSLQTLILRNNKLHGKLPEALRNCSSLGFVDFGLNKLSGKVPSWIGEDLPHLYALILKSNKFYGSMPYEICLPSNLHFLDLSINKISGAIPPCFANLTAMIRKGTEVTNHTYDSSMHERVTDANSSITYEIRYGNGATYSYLDNVLARWKGQELEYGRNFAYLKMIDLSSNELTGEFPMALTRLIDLKGLNLSGNRFYGNIPPEIGQLKVLESLDLSKNKFSGKIPSSASGLNFLAYLDLSYNNFSGRIPSGTQLQGFNTSTYEGNTELCGKPLTNICSGDEPTDSIQPSSGKYDFDGDDGEYKRWLYIGTVLGFSTSFWGIIGTLVLNRRWRNAYFLFLWNKKEHLYVAMAVWIARLQRKFKT